MTQYKVYHPHRRDRGYYESWRSAQHRRAHRIGRRLFRLLVIAMALAPFAAAAIIVAMGGGR